MIEIQIKDEKLYYELKQYANYHSDLTKVCSFRDELADLLKDKGLEFNYENKNKIKPLLDIQGRNIMKLVNAPAEMLYFVGVRSEYDPTIPIRCMHEVSLLIENNLVDLSDNFKEVYSKLSYRDKISELISAKVKFYGKGALIDFIDPDLTIQSLQINDCKEKDLAFKQLSLEVTEPIEELAKYHEIKAIEPSTGHKYTLRFYSKAIILKSIAFKGNKINISTNKIIEQNGSYVVYDPFILPKGLMYIKDVMYTPPGRKIPVDLYRNAMYEFMYRYNAKH